VTQIGRSAARQSITLPGPDGGAGGGTVDLAWGAATDIGRKRKHNEDSWLAESPMFVVADGMGGHAAGDVASAAVVRRLAEGVSTDFAEPEAIVSALRVATADITLADDVDDRGVGTTVTGAALTIQDGLPYWAVFNIGDSRVYQFQNNELSQVTVDHSVVQELVDAGMIRPEDAESHPDSNVITRAVGFNSEPMIDLWTLPARQGLRLLICSDGLTREVSEDRLRLHLAAGLSPQETAAALVEAALAAGGRDNITTVIVDVIGRSGGFEIDDTLPGGTTADQ
jgi:serine/threonine protein phosphatase PrpC